MKFLSQVKHDLASIAVNGGNRSNIAVSGGRSVPAKLAMIEV
jgi:hypothetical protein